MGYYTRYTLEAPEHIIAAVRDRFECACLALDESGATEEPCKWYDWDKNLLTISAAYPTTLSTLSGVWRAYFFKGQCEKVKPTTAWLPCSLK